MQRIAMRADIAEMEVFPHHDVRYQGLPMTEHRDRKQVGVEL